MSQNWLKKKVESSLNLPVTLVFWIFDTLPALTALLTWLLLLLLLAVAIDELIPLSRTWFKLSALRAEVTQGATIGTSWQWNRKMQRLLWMYQMTLIQINNKLIQFDDIKSLTTNAIFMSIKYNKMMKLYYKAIKF